MGWAWESPGDKNPSITLNIPESAEKRDYELRVTAKNGEEETKTVTIPVGKSIIDQYDKNDDGEIDGDEVRSAIQGFLFGDEMSGEKVRKVIQAFLFD